MRVLRFLLCAFFLLICFLSTRAQDFSNKGTDFWIAYTGHIDGTSSRMALYISSTVNTSGEVQLDGKTISFTVTANQATTVQISPKTYNVYNAQSDGINSGYGIHVTSQQPISLYAHILNAARSGSTLVLPVNVLGKEYIALAYKQVSNNTNPANSSAKSQITVVGVEDNTTVEINPVAASIGNTRPANTKFQIVLNKGDVYQYQSNTDLTGSTIKSISGTGTGCKPIAVFTGSTWTYYDCGQSSGDNLYQQLFPIPSWGKNFLTAPFATKGYDIFRIIVNDVTTQVTVNGGVLSPASLINNQYYEFTSSSANQISADKPIEVIQYMTTQNCGGNAVSDPEIVTINPLEQTIDNATVVSARNDLTPPNTNITVHYLNIIMRAASTGSLKIDNAAPKGSWVPIGSSGYSYLQENVTASTQVNPSHNITADDGFIAIAYGMGNVESYGYNAGTNVRDFSPTPAFKNSYARIDSAVTCKNTPTEFAIPLTFIPTSIQWDFSAAPNISPNAGIGPQTSFTSDSTSVQNGVSYYYYSTHKTFVFSNANSAALRDTIKLYTTSSTPDGCGNTSQTYAMPVTVRDVPTAGFSVTGGVCVTDSVHFIDNSAAPGGAVTRWLWDFGDGRTADLNSTPPSPFVYSSSGTHQIKLNVISDIGCISDTATQSVTGTDKPVASFTASTLRCIGQQVSFTDASTTPSGSLVKWLWNLDNGGATITNTTNAGVTGQYSSDGTFHPSLTVVSNSGCQSDPYQPGLLIHPTPSVGFTLPEVCLNDAFAVFNDTSSISDGSQAQFTWNWNFNAGTPAVSPGPSTTVSTAQNPQVKYNKADHYQVSLTVTSKDGCAATKVQAFTVNGANPKAAFSITSAQPYCGTVPVVIQNNSTVDFGNVTRLVIYWEDGVDTTIQTVDETPAPGKLYGHSYPDPQLALPQNFTIRMVAYSGGTACMDGTSQSIKVYPKPKTAFTMSATQICSGQIVSFQDKGNGVSSAAVNWTWNMGAAGIVHTQNPVQQFTDSGQIQITQFFVNQDGCVSDTAAQNLQVYPNPVLVLKHTAQVLSGGVYTIQPDFVYGNSLQYLWTPATYLSSDTAAAPVTTPADDITYRLIVTAQGGCTATDTIFIKVLKGPEVPNIFSPNGDGIHDTWHIANLESYPGATVQVYDRFGQVVFSTVGYSKDWDGTYKGKPLPVGTYYYVINPKNGRAVVSGSVTIIR